MLIGILTPYNDIEVLPLDNRLLAEYEKAEEYEHVGNTIAVSTNDNVMTIGDSEDDIRNILQDIIDSES
jgi:hypothetical protein